MTRILSYNILVGGKGRIDTIECMIRSANPDVVGLVEATDQDIVKELACRLGMEYRTNAIPGSSWKPETALLSRLPIVYSQAHANSLLRTRSLLEVCLQPEYEEKLTVFVTHLIANFFHGRGGDGPRRREVREVLRIMRANHGPHALIGDFNALAPGDKMKASNLLRYLVELDRRHEIHPEEKDGQPSLHYVMPPKLRFLSPLLRLIPRSQLLSMLFDEGGSLYAPRGSISILNTAGYVDCFRYMNPRAWGFTCPAAAPAGRIDYIFANPLLATRLSACKVITGGEEVKAIKASDHLPIMADFGTEVATTFRLRLGTPIERGETFSEAL
jgi:endonuclease/exonuclease/phosphatase family metal-dependent hydrolase